MNNTIKTFKNTRMSNDFKQSLDILNNKMNQIKKNITYYDIFNITDSLTDHHQYASKINALVPNSSLVINTVNGFSINDELFNVGDVVVKSASGDVIHIKAQSGGIFFPAKFTKVGNSNNYELQYKYQPNPPEQGDKNYELAKEATTASSKMTFKIEANMQPKDSYIYGIWAEVINGSYTFEKAIYTEDNGTETGIKKEIEPMIKFYFKYPNNTFEEVSIEYNLTATETNWIVTVDSLKDLWIKVK